MGEVVRASRLRSALERLGSALDPERHREREQVRDLLKHLRELRVENERRADAVAVRLDAIGHAAEALRQDAASSRRALERTRRDALRQRALVNRLLHRSGVDQRSAEVEERVTARLARIARSRLPVIVGPWTGEVGFELLYWIPFLQWVRETFPIDPARMIVVSRGGVSSWYGHVAGAYDDIFATETPDAFRAATEDRKKQKRIRTFDRRVVRTVMRARGIRQAYLLHPTLMYGLFNSFWRYAATVKRLEEFARFRRLPAVAGVLDGRAALPDRYVAVRFYFSDCFPDTPANRALVDSIVSTISRQMPVVLVNTPFAVDDHRDAQAAGGRVLAIDPSHMLPEQNLAVQTAVIACARAFVGTYGGYSYLAPFCGVPAIAFYSVPTFKAHHLHAAQRVFERLGGATVVPLDAATLPLVRLALSGTLASTVS
jgi:hypothetical protein